MDKEYKLYIFDWDGTISDNLNIWLKAFSDTYKNYGFDLPDQEVIKLSWGTWQKGPAQLGIENPTEFMNEVIAKGTEDAKSAALYPGAADYLKRLKANGAKIAVVTSSLDYLINPALSREGLDGVVDMIVDAVAVTHKKPDPEGINKVIDAFKTDLSECIYFGDTEKDIQAAKNANIDSCLFFPDWHKKFYDLDNWKTYDPTYVIESFEGLN